MSKIETIKEAKEFLRKNFEEGAECPCCGQFVKRVNRKVTSSMAYGLILLCKSFKVRKNFDLEKFFKEQKDLPTSIRNEMTRFKYWKILVEIEDEKSEENGFYYLTENAFDFVNNKLRISKNAYLYNDKFLGLSPETVNIVEALGDKYNYHQVMGVLF